MHNEEKKTEVAVLGRTRWVVLSVYLVCEGDGNRAAATANSLRAEQNIHVDRRNPGREKRVKQSSRPTDTRMLRAHMKHITRAKMLVNLLLVSKKSRTGHLMSRTMIRLERSWKNMTLFNVT